VLKTPNASHFTLITHQSHEAALIFTLGNFYDTLFKEMEKSLTSLVIQKINQLPPDLVKQVNDFVDVLLRENKVGGSIKEYEEAIKEITLHKKGKIKLSTLEEMLSEI